MRKDTNPVVTDQADRSSIAFDLTLVARQWRLRADERFAALGLTQAKWLPLYHLSRSDGRLPQRELVQLMGIEGPSLVRLLDELERMGLIERRDGDADRRTKIVHLTSAAKPIVQQLAVRAERLRAEILDGIEARELAIFRRVLAGLADNLDNLAP